MKGATVRCWGDNARGAFGDGTTSSTLIPIPIAALTGVPELAAGSYHSCVRLIDLTMRCSGHNVFGQLGDGTKVDHFTYAPVVWW